MSQVSCIQFYLYDMINYSDLKELKSVSKLKDFDSEYSILKKRIDGIFEENTNCIPIFISVTGSVSYGIDTESSDIDCKIIYYQTDIIDYSEYNMSNYNKQIDVSGENDITCYEIGRYIELLIDNNPNIIELLNVDEQCVVYETPIWIYAKSLFENKVLSKKCYYTFFNYAKQQIDKSMGLNKKINNPISKERKSPLDFCTVVLGNKTVNMRKWLKDNRLNQIYIGLSKIPNAKDLYSVYYDYNFEKNGNNPKRYKGIIKENDNTEVSNEIRTSNIEKGETLLALLSYNKDGYTVYCKKYREYWGETGWMNVRNEARYIDNTSNKHSYDGKNLSTAIRLCFMAEEITRNVLCVRRSLEEREFLLGIRKGNLTHEELIIYINGLIENMKSSYENCDLPDTPDMIYLKNCLVEIRKMIYKN